MKRIVKTVNEEKKIIQTTVEDERWYSKPGPEGELIYVPSVTWITSFYPKGVAFFKWLASKGWNEAETIKLAAGDKGSKVHNAIGDLLEGQTLGMTDKYPNVETGVIEELGIEEYECLMSFVNWWKGAQPILIAKELVVFNENENYAGTLDLICKIPRIQSKKEIKEKKSLEYDLWLIDFKTSPSIWPSFELQVSAYKEALMEQLIREEARKGQTMEITAKDVTEIKLGILQVGYKRTQKGYKLTEIEDKVDLFHSAMRIWEHETKGISPLKRDYPVELTLNEGNVPSEGYNTK